jgi:hypothetical protein
MTSRVQWAYAIVMAVLGWAAVLLQIGLAVAVVLGEGRPVWDGLVNTLSYFTVSTNLIAAAVATALALPGRWSARLAGPATVTAVAVYMAVVGLVYSLLLRSLWRTHGLQLAANIALHDVLPVLFVLYWLAFTPKGTLRWRWAPLWLSYPLAYVAYSLVRGALVQRYPYPFVDVIRLGYPRALANTAAILIGFLTASLVAIALDRWLGRRRPGGAA